MYRRRWSWPAVGRIPVLSDLALVGAAVLIVLLMLVVLPVYGKHAAAKEQEGKIDRETKAAIIDSLAWALDDTYVFPDVAEKMSKQLERKLKKKEYESLGTLEAFTQQLTEDMREISKDRHLWIRPASEDEIRESRKEEPTDEDRERYRARQAYTNYGFEKVERLPGNIGYLKFNRFSDTEFAHETAVAAMHFIEHCDAVIIDLRENGGGSPSMVQLISTYFLEESTHLNSFYIRKTDETKQFWSYNHIDGNRRPDVPLYVLTSRYTFSGAEEFTYNMKNLERATIIGETTGGGAHPTRRFVFPDLKVIASVPFGRAVNPITGTNWEGTGIEPHIAVPQEEALEVARLEAMKAVAGKTEHEEVRQRLEFAIKRLEAIREPAEVDAATRERYVGRYGPRRIFLEGGKLMYKREERPKYEMIPISDTLFCFEEIEYFLLKVELDEGGNPIALVGLYDNGHTDRSPRDK